MERKVVLGMMLVLILVVVLNVPLTVAEVGVDGPKSQIFNGDDLEPFSVGEDLWNFSNIIEWSRFAYVNEYSAEVVIGLSDTQPQSYDRLSSLTCKSCGEIVNTVSMGGKTVALVVNMSVKTASSFVESVRATGLTKYIEPNMRFQAQLTPNDPYWSLQWGPRKIEADYAWNTTIGDPSVLVAVIDTGTDYNHPDLVDNYVALGYDWVNNDTDPMDDHGHGTHCAGIIAATLNNSIGIAGVAQVRIMAEKGLGSGGSGSASDLASAIIHAVDQGADILSNSWGGSSYSELIHDAVEYAKDHGVLVVAAAGNDASSMKNYPAAYDEVVAVTATDRSDDPASFTSYGKWVDVAAPGVQIYSTVSEVHDPYFTANYSYANGTSMACPHAAGVAALIWSEFPSLTRDEVRLRLQVTADDLGDPGFDVYYGYGRVNARRAVEPLPSHDLLILNWKRPAYVEPGSSGIINTTVLNFGSNNETGITVQLRVNGSVVDSAYISSLESMKSVTVSCSWSPTVDGRYYVESYVVPVSGETVVENNVRSAYINVRVGKFIRVPEDYSRIQEAVDLAGPGETIKVASGTYYERVSIDTSLKLFGEDRDTTVIDGNGIGIVVGVTADSVEIRGFTVQNSGVNLPRGGIVLMGVKNCVVTNNTLINDFEGVLLWECTGNNSVYGNIAFSNEDAGIGSVYSTGRDIISDNAMTGGQFGVAIVSFISGSIVSRNVITNSEYGICICADNNTVVDNTITLCSDCGIWLLFSNNTISENRVKNNERGILLDFASSNRIYHNDFVHNTIQVYFEISPLQNTWDDGYPSGGNYWSDYTGVDVKSGPNQDQPGSDGIGDTPYFIDEDNTDNYPLMYMRAPAHYVVMGGMMDTAGQLGEFPAWHFGDWAAGEGVPFATRPPYLTPMSMEQKIAFSDPDPVTGVVNLTVLAETYIGLNHTYWDPRIETYVRFQTILKENGYGWLFTGNGTDSILGDVDYYVFSNSSGTYFFGSDGLPSTPDDVPAGPPPQTGPDGIPGTPDDYFGTKNYTGTRTPDPPGSSILYLPTTLHIDYWDNSTESWQLLCEALFPMVMTTATAYNVVIEPTSGINGANKTQTGQPWEFLAGLDHPEYAAEYPPYPTLWEHPRCNAYVTYACVWSMLNISTARGDLDIIYEVVQKLVREDCVIADIDCNEEVDIFDIVKIGVAYGATDEGFNHPVANATYDARADLDGNGIIDIYDLVRCALDYGAKLTPWCIIRARAK